MTESAASRSARIEQRGGNLFKRVIRTVYDGGSPHIDRAPQVYSHFTEKAIDATNAPWVLHETHTTTASTFAIVTAGSGVLGGQAAAATDPTAVAADAWTVAFGGLLWQPDTTAIAGVPMFVEARMKFADTAASEFFFGYQDAANQTSDISYALTVTDSTITTSAPSDGFGFLTSGTTTGGDFDSSSSTVVLGGISSIGGTDTAFVPGVTAAYKSTAPVQGGSGGFTYPSSSLVVTDSVFYTLRVELDVNGNGKLFYNHRFFASFPAAVTKTVPLAAVINGIARSTAQMKVTLDYVSVGGAIPLAG
jgi:hypothetical protein